MRKSNSEERFESKVVEALETTMLPSANYVSFTSEGMKALLVFSHFSPLTSLISFCPDMLKLDLGVYGFLL